MLRPDSASRRDIVTDFAIGLIADEGVGALTVRGLARRIRVTPAGLQHWAGPRREMLVLITATFGRRWQQWMWRRQFRDGALALLPTTHEEVIWTRVWLGLQELGRTEVEVGEVVSAIRAHELDLLTRSEPQLTDDDVVAVLALVDGLRVTLCHRTQPLDPLGADPLAARVMLRRWIPTSSAS